MEQSRLNWIASFMWEIAVDVLREADSRFDGEPAEDTDVVEEAEV